MPKSPYSGGEEPMTLELDCWSDELSPAQLKAFEVAESEHLSIRNKLSDIVSTSGGENVFLGEVFSAYHVPGPAPGLENIAKPVAAVRKENRARVAAEEKLRRAAEAATRKREQEEEQQQQQQQEDDDDEYMPLQKRAQLAKGRPPSVQDNKKKLDVKTPLGRKPEHSPPTTVGGAFRPTENTSIGGLSVGDKRKEVVDLTKDDTVGGKVAADSKEITFNKLQGKTFPSLVVVARPSLKVKENINDRPALDAKVKGVLMHTATKFTEWLIQQGLVRSEQTCQIHSGQLKLGMYSDVSKFAYSGGYVWISTCCPTRFVSVFNGSLFEGAPHPPSTLLKLIYHWSCQTNVQNVVQWVKVDNLYVKGLYAWLRSVCTVALSQHMRQLGGPGRKIEVGVISLGTTSQDGQQRQVKVEVLGVLDFESKVVRLRAVEPLNDGERNYKKRFSKILEPLANWVHKDSLILTDLTVDKGTLHTMGYKHVQQMSVAASSASSKSSNANIMDYLRRIVPRMFQNTLSLLSRQIIQQFLDELVWRESYGTTPGTAFDNIVSHISEQTRLDAKESLVHRLNKVGANPFKSWAHLSVRMPAKKLRDDFFNSASRTSPADIPAPAAASTSSISSGGADSTPKRGRKRRDPSPEYTPYNKNKIIKEELKRPKLEPVKVAAKVVEEPPPPPPKKKDDGFVKLENYYYGIIVLDAVNDSAKAVKFRAQCPECHETFSSNVSLMKHLLRHAKPIDLDRDSNIQCHYCLDYFEDDDKLKGHFMSAHPIETKSPGVNGMECLICEYHCSGPTTLAAHMQKTHAAYDLPYKCGCCNYASSSRRFTINHFYNDHSNSGMLQCPLCMQIFGAVDNSEQVVANSIVEYLNHMKMHMDPNESKKCPRCTLSFVQKAQMKVHAMYAHASQNARSKSFFEMCKNSTKIMKPKYRAGAQKEQITFLTRYPYLNLIIDNGRLCLECNTDFEEKSHIPGLMSCSKCKYHTCCLRAMLEHSSACIGINLETASMSKLDAEMHCVCGFSNSEGNALARHLATCDRRSAYATVESAQENIVKRNMLDMLGLVRRGDDEEESDDLLQPVTDRRASTAESEDDTMASTTEQSSTTPTVPPSVSEVAAGGGTVTSSGGGGGGADDADQQQFNTQLSLDDLAPPSVAPQPETDRTPRCDEYQSLATPRVGPTPEAMHEGGEFELPGTDATSANQQFESL